MIQQEENGWAKGADAIDLSMIVFLQPPEDPARAISWVSLAVSEKKKVSTLYKKKSWTITRMAHLCFPRSQSRL